MLNEDVILYEDENENFILKENRQLYQKICDLIADQKKSEAEKLHLILLEYIKDPAKTYKAIMSADHDSYKIKHEDILKLLIYSIENNLFFTTKFLLDFLEFCFIKEQKISDIIDSNLYNLKPLLFIAIRHDFEGKIVKLLLDKNSNVNLLLKISRINPEKQIVNSLATPLTEAVNVENEEAFKLLIDHPDIDLFTSIRFLYEEDLKLCTNLVKQLLEKISNTKKFVPSESTLLHEIFFKYGYKDLFKNLIKEKQQCINIKNAEGNNLLHSAILSENPFLDVKYLIQFQIDVNAQNNAGHTPLHLLATMRKLNLEQRHALEDIVRCLLSHNAKLDIEDNSGKTALNLASKQFIDIIQRFCFFGQIKAIITNTQLNEAQKIEEISVKYLENSELFKEIFVLSNEISLKPPLYSDLSVILSLSIQYNFFNLTKFLLDLPELLPEGEKIEKNTLNFRKEIIISRKIWKDLCLIHLAAKTDISGHITTLLINYGCNINTNSSLYTALEIAISFNQINSATAIIDHPNFNLRFHLLRFFSKECINDIESSYFFRLLMKIKNLEETNVMGETLLHEAVKLCRNDWMVETLILQKKPNLEAKTLKTGLTVLHIAFAQSSVETVKILLRSGANPDILSRSGISVFDHMVRYQIINIQDSSSDLDEMLVKKLKDISFKDKTKLLLKNHREIISKNSFLVFDPLDKTQNCRKFWQALISMMESARSELKEEESIRNSNKNVTNEAIYVKDRNSQECSNKKRRH